MPCLTVIFHPNKSASVPSTSLLRCDDAIVYCGTDIPDIPRQATLRDSVKDIAKQNEMSRFINRPRLPEEKKPALVIEKAMA